LAFLSFAVVGADGSFFKANFEKGGEAVRVAYAPFVKSSIGQLPPGALGVPLPAGVGAGGGGGGGRGMEDGFGAGYGGDIPTPNA
jgi:hypothetical protein